jgi:Fe-S-cluster-containing hydrogenase component 2
MPGENSMIIVNKSVCDECGTCVSVCPENAIVLAESLSIDNENCIRCCRCVDICPFGALTES